MRLLPIAQVPLAFLICRWQLTTSECKPKTMPITQTPSLTIGQFHRLLHPLRQELFFKPHLIVPIGIKAWDLVTLLFAPREMEFQVGELGPPMVLQTRLQPLPTIPPVWA